MPKFSFASAGRNNKYKHPSVEVKKRLQKIGSLWFDTKTSGSISWKMKGKEKPKQKERFYKIK